MQMQMRAPRVVPRAKSAAADAAVVAASGPAGPAGGAAAAASASMRQARCLQIVGCWVDVGVMIRHVHAVNSGRSRLGLYL